jgi:hypothetical protein
MSIIKSLICFATSGFDTTCASHQTSASTGAVELAERLHDSKAVWRG